VVLDWPFINQGYAMTDMPWVRFFPSDWLAGTRGMSATETGVYITLVATMYERQEPIPEDHARLARLCGAPVATFRRTLEALIDEGKIVRLESGLWNKRVGEESEYRIEKSEAGSNAAAVRWGKKSNKNNAPEHAGAMRAESEGNASQKPEARSQKDKPLAQHSTAAAPRDFLFDKICAAVGADPSRPPSWALDLREVNDLIAKGYDLERDILPVFKTKNRPGINKIRFFVQIIIDETARRAAIPPKPTAPVVDWTERIKAFRDNGTWPHSWGPKPDEPGCRAPKELTEQAA
jgi:uncharacterized protein YdaU (DUF1376 family)